MAFGYDCVFEWGGIRGGIGAHFSLAHTAPLSLGGVAAKSFYTTKKVNIDYMALQQSDVLRSNSK